MTENIKRNLEIFVPVVTILFILEGFLIQNGVFLNKFSHQMPCFCQIKEIFYYRENKSKKGRIIDYILYTAKPLDLSKVFTKCDIDISVKHFFFKELFEKWFWKVTKRWVYWKLRAQCRARIYKQRNLSPYIVF